jgi:hypothetical protein
VRREYTCVSNTLKLELLVINRRDFMRRVSGIKAVSFFANKLANKERLHTSRVRTQTKF